MEFYAKVFLAFETDETPLMITCGTGAAHSRSAAKAIRQAEEIAAKKCKCGSEAPLLHWVWLYKNGVLIHEEG